MASTTNPFASLTGQMPGQTQDPTQGTPSTANLATAGSTGTQQGPNDGRWHFVPTLDIGEIHSDNLRATAGGAAQSGNITAVAPSFSLIGYRPNLYLKLNYSLQAFDYAQSGQNNSYHHLLNADTKAILVQDLFFLDGAASMRPTSVSPFGSQSAGTYTLSDNQADIRTYHVSPYLRHRFGDVANGELRYAEDSVHTDQAGLLNTKTQLTSFRIDSGTAFRVVGWGIQAEKREIHYSQALPVDFESGAGSLYYNLTPRFKLTATAGHEKDTYLWTGTKPEGGFWSTGLDWTPSVLSKIQLEAGHRFFGPTYMLNASHRGRELVWSLGYHEDITTTQSQISLPPTTDTSAFLDKLWQVSIPDSNTRQQAIDAFIRDSGLPGSLAEGINAFTNRVFLQKSLQASVAANGVKNTVLVTAYHTTRDVEGSPQSAVALPATAQSLNDESSVQSGATAVWAWRLSATGSANLSTGYARVRGLSSGRTDVNKNARLAVIKNFRPKLKGTIELQRLKQTPNIGQAVTQNVATAYLTMSF